MEDNYFTTLWWFLPCTDMSQPWVSTCPPSWTHLPPHPIPLGCPWAPALSVLLHVSNLRWSSTLHMIIHMFQCYSLKSSYPCLLPESKSLFFISVSLLLPCILFSIVVPQLTFPPTVEEGSLLHTLSSFPLSPWCLASGSWGTVHLSSHVFPPHQAGRRVRPLLSGTVLHITDSSCCVLHLPSLLLDE